MQEEGGKCSDLREFISVEEKKAEHPLIAIKDGINEITGESGIGKTALAIYITKGKKTLYISARISKKRWFPEEFIIERIMSFLKLRLFVIKELSHTVDSLGIECIILDGLEDYLYEIRKPRLCTNEIFEIVRVLKRLSFNKGIGVIVVNNSHDRMRVGNIKIANAYIGIPWEYMINSRYVVFKQFEQRMVSIPVDGKCGRYVLKRFTIDNNGLHF